MKVIITKCLVLTTLYLNLFVRLKFECVYADAVLDDIDIDYLNGDYINMSNFEASVKFKRKGVHTLNLKMEFTRDLPDDTYLTSDISTRAFGYEIPTGLNFKKPLCDSKEGRAWYTIFATPMGMNDCPPKKGLYEKKDLELDFSKLSHPVPLGARFQFKIGLEGNGGIPIMKYRIFILT